MSTARTKERKRAQRALRRDGFSDLAANMFVRPQKVGTPPLSRTSTWRERDRWDQKKRRYVNEARPSQEAIRRGYVLDLGWQKPAAYLTRSGKLRKEARP